MASSDLDVVVVGAIGIDTNVFLSSGDIDFTLEGNFSENLDYVGQAGGYSSRGFAQLGKKTGFIGYVGNDTFGGYVAKELEQDGIETRLFIDPKGTRRSINLMYRDGRRKSFFDGKASMDVRPDLEACIEMLQRTRIVHVNIENWARYLLPAAKELGITISCDLQDIVSLDDPYRRDFIEHADLIFFSATNLADPAITIEELMRRKPDSTVVVGMGSKGCAISTQGGIRFFEPVQIEEPVIDTNGAGDSLAVGFLSSYCMDGFSLEHSVLSGQIAARHKCAQKATSSHLITRAQLDAYFHALVTLRL